MGQASPQPIVMTTLAASTEEELLLPLEIEVLYYWSSYYCSVYWLARELVMVAPVLGKR